MDALDKNNGIALYIAYSAEDGDLYGKFKPYIQKMKKSGLIHSYYERKIIGEKWDHVISDKLDRSRIILLLVSLDFISSEYCYGEEVQRMMELHTRGAAAVVPVLIDDIDLSDTPFGKIDVLPSIGKSVRNPYWENTKNALVAIFEEIKPVLKKIVTPSRDIFRFDGQPFPYCIKQFSIKNFLCIKDIYTGEIPVDTQWVLITGQNGDGKTALLQALAVGLLGNDKSSAEHLLWDNPDARIEIEFKSKRENKIQRFFKEKEYWKTERFGHNDAPPPRLMAYGVTRLKILTPESEDSLKDKKELFPVFSLYHETEGLFKNVETWLKEHSEKDEKQEKPIVGEVKNTLLKLLPSIDSIIIGGFPDKKVIYKEKGFDAEYTHVSSGSKMVIAMIGDMLKRFIQLQPDAQTVSDFEGIVFIDELDLHFHPVWQREFPGLLSSIFPKIQFWATTHSIVPFMGAPRNSVLFNITRTPEGGTYIERLEIDLQNISPNILLSSPLFDVTLLTVQNKYPDEFQTHDDWKTLENFKKIVEKLSNNSRDKNSSPVLNKQDDRK
jgi:predicted ATP-binding protein involved in virulence